jgi:hypothetical protein
VLGLAALVVLQLVLADSYWETSEGVYLQTAHQLLHGARLYDDVVAAQTPPLYLLGAGALAIDDALWPVRLALGVVQLGGAVLGGVLVWRLSASRAAAVAAVPLALLMPWTLREHGALLPELLFAPLAFAALLLAPRGAGVAAGALAFVKAPFVLPAIALVLVARERRVAALWALGMFGALGFGSLAVYGTEMWTQVVVAQFEVGRAGLDDLVGTWAQAAWNDGWLAIGALVAWHFRRTLEPRLLRATLALALATALTVLTTWKIGTSLTVLVPLEAVLLPLTLAGVVAAHRAHGTRATVLVCALIALPVAQALSLLARPHVNGAHPFLRPGSQPRYGVNLTGSEVDVAVAAARRCPASIPYSGPAFVAFVSGRRMPADQPDRFLPARAEVLRDVWLRMLADKPSCPDPAPDIP